MKNFNYYLIATLLLLGASCTQSKAQVNFDFTLTGELELRGSDPVPATVTGEIIGLVDNATSLPTDIAIFSAPAALNLNASTDTPYDFGTPNYSQSGTDPGVVLSSGQLTFSSFEGRDLHNVIFEMSFDPTDPTYNSGFLEGANESVVQGTFTISPGGPYTPPSPPSAPVDAPEPSTWALMLGGLGTLAFFSRRMLAA